MKVGDIIELDVGYNGMIHMSPCKVMSLPREHSKLFPESPRTKSFEVRICGTGEVFNASVESNHPDFAYLFTEAYESSTQQTKKKARPTPKHADRKSKTG